jgi:hypothetical protein
MINDEERHYVSLGKLVGNLQSLEFLLRGFLATVYDAGPDGLINGMPKDMGALQIGEKVPVNHMTNYDSLGKLIDKYNGYVREKKSSLVVDKELVVDLRDALVHGRVSGVWPNGALKILKFSKQDGGQVCVEFSQTIDADWFKSRIRLVYEAAKRVYAACELFAPSMIV